MTDHVETATPPRPPLKKYLLWGGGGLFLFWVVGGFGLLFGDGFVAGQMPACDSRAVAKLLRQALEEAPGREVKVSDATDFKQVKASGATNPFYRTDQQVCSATVYTNAGKHHVSFTIEWMGNDKSKIWLQTIPF